MAVPRGFLARIGAIEAITKRAGKAITTIYYIPHMVF
jgi:hypothetical protein